MINYLCKPRCVSVTTSVKLFGLYYMFFVMSSHAVCLIWVNGILLSFALILCVSLMLSCVIIFKNMSNQFVHMMNFRWSAQGFYPMPCPQHQPHQKPWLMSFSGQMLFYEQEKEVGNTSRTKSYESMKWRKAAAPTAPKAMADVLFQ